MELIIMACWIDDILSAYERWSFKESLPVDAQKKVSDSVLSI